MPKKKNKESKPEEIPVPQEATKPEEIPEPTENLVPPPDMPSDEELLYAQILDITIGWCIGRIAGPKLMRMVSGENQPTREEIISEFKRLKFGKQNAIDFFEKLLSITK